VVCYVRSDLVSHIRTLPPPVALAVVGALHDLPKGWEAGLKQPAQHLAAVAARAEAHAGNSSSSTTAAAAAAAGAAGRRGSGETGGDEDGWVTAGGGKDGSRGAAAAVKGGGGSNGRGGSSVVSGVSLSVLWKQLEEKRPDVCRALHDRHKLLLRPLNQDQQKQVREGRRGQLLKADDGEGGGCRLQRGGSLRGGSLIKSAATWVS